MFHLPHLKKYFRRPLRMDCSPLDPMHKPRIRNRNHRRRIRQRSHAHMLAHRVWPAGKEVFRRPPMHISPALQVHQVFHNPFLHRLRPRSQDALGMLRRRQQPLQLRRNRVLSEGDLYAHRFGVPALAGSLLGGLTRPCAGLTFITLGTFWTFARSRPSVVARGAQLVNHPW